MFRRIIKLINHSTSPKKSETSVVSFIAGTALGAGIALLLSRRNRLPNKSEISITGKHGCLALRSYSYRFVHVDGTVKLYIPGKDYNNNSPITLVPLREYSTFLNQLTKASSNSFRRQSLLQKIFKPCDTSTADYPWHITINILNNISTSKCDMVISRCIDKKLYKILYNFISKFDNSFVRPF